MASVTIEVDLNDFDISEIGNYLLRKRNSTRKYDQQQSAELIKLLFGGRKDIGPENLSKVDQWKNELWPQIRDKYSLEQLETFLNS